MIELERLRQLDYFSALSDEQLAEVAAISKHHTFEANALIFLQGEPSAGLWIIESGNVKITKLSSEGNEYILHLLGPGHTFNDISALDGGPNPAFATALSLVTGWVLPSESLRDFLRTNPEAGLMVIDVFAGRIRALAKQMEDLALYSVAARLASFLLKQADNPALAGPGITRTAIAGHLATTPETVSRVLGKLQDAGAIRFDRHRILIVNEALLESIAASDEFPPT